MSVGVAVVEEAGVSVSLFLIYPVAIITVAADALGVCGSRGCERERGGKECFLVCCLFHFNM
jgi:hypothetical protein